MTNRSPAARPSGSRRRSCDHRRGAGVERLVREHGHVRRRAGRADVQVDLGVVLQRAGEMGQERQPRLDHRHGGKRGALAQDHSARKAGGFDAGEVDRHALAGPPDGGILAVDLQFPHAGLAAGGQHAQVVAHGGLAAQRNARGHRAEAVDRVDVLHPHAEKARARSGQAATAAFSRVSRLSYPSPVMLDTPQMGASARNVPASRLRMSSATSSRMSGATRLILVMATMPPRAPISVRMSRCSRVWGMTLSSAATTKITTSMPWRRPPCCG